MEERGVETADSDRVSLSVVLKLVNEGTEEGAEEESRIIETPSIYSLLRGSALQFPVQPDPAPASQSVLSVTAEAQRLAYDALIGRRTPRSDAAAEEALAKRQISTLVNILFSAVGVAVSLFWAMTQQGRSAELSLAAALAVGTLMLVVEAIVYRRVFTEPDNR